MPAALPSVTQIYKALGHPARLRILAMLRSGELCACQITAVLELAPSTVSAHLAELRRAGVVTERKDGRWVHYQIAETDSAQAVLQVVWRQLGRDEQVRSDARVVRQLRTIPVEQLCRVDLDLAQLAISRHA
ncbi:MAG: metalloregulator ArsR/SmtB family transcription factor [Gemmatimonadales bacterium]|nr:metalloregulator ArsR/SmtB family transcription factor [Gemmatimonadales bacterium]NIN12946.1 metalloregulator ArsR/SmtB family transcription factor [Gemmatimonadales bacterium]NIR02621.1 metalloregulator ArsR/SmtB family transcription factor [Gemmatimonadales bacterium]NIS67197.1 metalloregulator ArsR/SmtB family transcription factor [Gemmatimonadales bacterium]